MIVNDLLVKFDRGYVNVTHEGSISLFGHKQGSIQLGGVGTKEAATYLGNLYLTTAAIPQIAPDVAYVPANLGEVPYFGFQVGDRISGPDPLASGLQPLRVLAVTVTDDADGNPIYGMTLRTRLQDASDRIARIMRKTGDQGNGIYESARPAELTKSTGMATRSPEWGPFSFPGKVVNAPSGDYLVPYTGRVTSVFVTVGTPGAELDLVFFRNGKSFPTFTNGAVNPLSKLPAGASDVAFFTNQDFAMGDKLSVAVLVVPGTPPPSDLLVVPKVSS